MDGKRDHGMGHSEDDLRTVLSEHGRAHPVREVSHEDVARLGRRMRLRRRIAGAVVTGTCVALAAAALPLAAGRTGSSPADPLAGPNALAGSATSEPKLPPALDSSLPIPRGRFPLVHSETHSVMGKRVRVTYTPQSVYTMQVVRCADPRAWVVTRETGKNGGTAGSFGRCGNEGAAQYDDQSAGPGWVGRPQTIEVWVFPSDAPIVEPRAGNTAGSCGRPDPERPRTPVCMDDLLDGDQGLERFAAQVGTRPGEWAVGIYDKAVP
ncbi:MAG TPA: hypothetical protein VGP70_13010 [Actinomadura sp.]|jgi:hypothetical protein|nr:hypothetical protein [Actinomadura sp.]